MKIQLALDAISLEDAKKLVRKIHKDLDIVELGTPFIWTYPKEVIGEFKKEFPDVEILADYKIMDGGSYCANLAYDAGADIVTVAAASLDSNIAGVVEAGKKNGKKVLCDMMAIPNENIKQRALEIERLGVDYVCIHRGLGVSSSLIENIKILKESLTSAKVAVAGGINLETMIELASYKPDLVIVGGVLTNAKNPDDILKKLRSIGEGGDRNECC